jgi:chitin synthase
VSSECLQVSWGTKGSDKAEALPSVSSSKTKDADSAVVVDTTKVQEDVDAAFKETVTRAITKVNVKDVVEKPNLDDQNKTFRTRLVAMWMLTNAALAIAIENINGLPSSNASVDQQELATKQNIYFSVILYSTFALAAVRFIGVCDLSNLWYPSLSKSPQCLYYFFKRNLFRCCRRN